MQCGVACLAMICHGFGQNISLETLDRLCHPTKDGVSLKSIADAASAVGLHSTATKITIDILRQCPLPAILHWGQNHFVLLISISGNRYKIADPAKGILSIQEEAFVQKWASTREDSQDKGIAMFFNPTNDFTRLCNDTDMSNQRNFKVLFGYIRHYRTALLHVIAGMAIGAILQLLLPFLTQAIVDKGINGKNISLVWLILIGELLIIAGRTATDFLRRWLLLHISTRVNISIVSDFFIKLMQLPMAFFDTRQVGDIIKRMDDHDRVQSFLTGEVLNIFFSIICFTVFAIILAYYDIVIFLIFIIGGILYGLWVSMFLKRRKILDYDLFEHQAKVQNKTFNMVTSMQEIKLQDCEKRRRWEWEDAQSELFEVQLKAMKLTQTREAGSIFINEIKNIIITVLSATAVIHGDITLGGMMAIQYIIGQLNAPIAQMMAFVYSFQDVKISLERINEIHCSRNEDSRESHSSSKSMEYESIDINVRNLNFRYDIHSSSLILNNLNLKIPNGKVTAIVGASGSGKTTLIKLLLGYYQPENGEILINNTPLSELNLKEWRQQCGVVMQDGVIFSDSIAQNIATKDIKPDVKNLEKSANMACIHDYIMSRPLKYNTIIGREGNCLSQGQRQRILIARAIYRNPKLLILDEATNALDAYNER